jgi:hypothetical protein
LPLTAPEHEAPGPHFPNQNEICGLVPGLVRRRRPGLAWSDTTRRPRALPLVCALCLALFLPASAPADTKRVVSLNLCTDEYLALLAPASIAALSPLASDPSLSVVAGQAARLPRVRPDAEAVLQLHPDLVLAGEYGAQTVLAFLRHRGIRVVQVPEADDFTSVAAETYHLAAILHAETRGVALVAHMKAVLAGVVPRVRGRAILWQARGYSAGQGSFGDALLRAAGFADAGTGGSASKRSSTGRRTFLLRRQHPHTHRLPPQCCRTRRWRICGARPLIRLCWRAQAPGPRRRSSRSHIETAAGRRCDPGLALPGARGSRFRLSR